MHIIRNDLVEGKLIMLGRGERGIQYLTFRDSLSTVTTKGSTMYMNTEASMWVHLVAQR